MNVSVGRLWLWLESEEGRLASSDWTAWYRVWVSFSDWAWGSGQAELVEKLDLGSDDSRVGELHPEDSDVASITV